MQNLRQKLAQFMYGRYGVDKLYYALLIVYFVLLVINVFARSWIISILLWAIVIWAFFRVFSRNVYSRQRENQFFLQAWAKIQSWFKLTFRKIKDIKTKRYRKCPYCSTVLRLPNIKGEHSTTCPRCHKEFKVKIKL